MNPFLKNVNLIFYLALVLGSNVLNAQKLRIEYSTFLGGSSDDRAHGMALNAQKNVCITAPIQSTNFPITSGALNYNFTGMMAAEINNEGDSLIFSTFLGAVGGANYAHGVAFDKEGCIYVTGNTTNADFLTTAGAFDRTYNGPGGSSVSHGDAFVMKLNPEGNQIIYSTYIGGQGWDISGRITVDEDGSAYIVGTTSSEDLPVTPGAFDTTFNGGGSDGRADIFVAKLDASGNNLLYCTYIGGSGIDTYGRNILVDDKGSLYFAGTTASSDFPTTNNAFDISYNGGSGNRGAGDGVFVKLNPTGNILEYSTFIGGSGDDFGNSFALDNKGNVYAAGACGSADYPTTRDAYDSTSNNGGFIVKFNPQSGQLLYSSLWKAAINVIAVHESGAAIISGVTASNNISVTPDALDIANNGSNDIYISVLNPELNSLIYGTYFGGSGHDIVESVLLDGSSLYVCGETTSANFPVTPASYDSSFNGGTNPYGGDAFIAKFILNDLPASINKSGLRIPEKFRLYQNYPNPFNPSTVLGYRLSENGKVTLKVYDTLGREIKTLIDSFQSTGEHSVVWDGTDNINNPVCSGVYFYSLTSDASVVQKKMLLIR